MSIATELENLFDELWPINRSLTGNGNRETLKILSGISPINFVEVPSGTTCFDWKVPPEWNVSEAYVETEHGQRVVDFKVNNLHLMGYSVPINALYSWTDLEKHLHFIESMPDVIPYKTSYYKQEWGFCLSYNQYLQLNKAINYRVVINSTLNNVGSMTIGDALIKGRRKEEILFSTYICHPSLANNELSGPILSVFLQRLLASKRGDHEYSYRFLYLPETIGSIYYLSVYGEYLKSHVVAGFVLTCVGDGGKLTFKLSREGTTLADRAALYVLKSLKKDFNLLKFFPTGSDERQYCSPYFNMPVASLMRSMYGKYEEYHTSLDNKNIMNFDAMGDLLDIYRLIVEVIEVNKVFQNTLMKCEPFLQNKNLYDSVGGPKDVPINTESILWLLNQSDGENDLLQISDKSSISVFELAESANKLLNVKLLKELK